MAGPTAPHAESGVLLLADITGYTTFLETVATAHPEMGAGMDSVPPAYELMVTLLDVVADGLAPLFTPIATEGDAVFAIADADAVANRGTEVLEVIGATYAAFHERGEQFRRMQDHDCDACPLISTLELKFIAHAGTFVTHRLPTRTHVAGPSVNLAHRLLKNHVTDATRLRGYLLITDAARELIGLGVSEGATHAETYDDAGAVSGVVIPLETAPA